MLKKRDFQRIFAGLIVIIGSFSITSCSQKGDISPSTKTNSAFSLETLIIDSVEANNTTIFIKIHFNKQYSEIINKKITYKDSHFDLLDENSILLLTTQLDSAKKETIEIYFGMGMSFDPHFTIINKDRIVGEIEGLELTIPGNGKLYSCGHINNLHNEAKQWKITSQGIEEQQQPFRYVGLKTFALSNFMIYEDTLLQSSISSIHKNDSIELLIQQNNFYLIKTQHNIVGWWKLDNSFISKQIDKLYFLGD